jgi:hypothetical protein
MIVKVEKDYPDALVLESMKIRQSQFDYTSIGRPAPIDLDILAALSVYELSFLNLLEDTTGWSFSFIERRSYYYQVLRYWNTIIVKTKPDILVAFTIPHTTTDYALYLLCKHFYSIPILFVDPKPFFGRQLHIIGCSIEDLSLPIRNVYESNEVLTPTSRLISHLRQLRGEDALMPADVERSYKIGEKYQGFQYKEFFRLMMSVLALRAFRESPLSFKKNRRPFSDRKSRLNKFNHFFLTNRIRKNNISLGKHYSNVTDDFDEGIDYVYFSAPYQPEAVTCPNAGYYEDLFLALDMISSSIPRSWIIYYKEHPMTFRGFSRGSLRRDIHYYNKLRNYGNLKIIGTDINTFKLIDNAKLVSTVSGTAAWEAVVRGVPAISFGSAWHHSCKGIFWIRTLKDCEEAIQKVVEGFRPKSSDVLRYAAAIEKIGVEDIVHFDFYETIKTTPNPLEKMKLLGEAIHVAYDRLYNVNAGGLGVKEGLY